jgi:hypothetical protein
MVSSFGSIVSVSATVLFLYLIYHLLVAEKELKNYP